MRKGLLGLAMALAAGLATAAPAGAHIFWANKYDNAIGRSNLDGSGVNQSFISLPPGTHPVGLAADSTHVYWTAYEDPDAIGRARLDGSGVEPGFITGADDPVGVVVDATHVYWTNAGSGTIGRARLDGLAVDQAFISGLGTPYGLAVDGAHVYWTDGALGTIGRAKVDGSGANPLFVIGAIGGATALAADRSHIYWVGAASDAVGRAGIDGGNADPSFIEGEDPWGVAVDSGHVYWTNQGPPKTAGRAGLDGRGAVQGLVPASPLGVYGVAVSPLETTIGEGPADVVRLREARFSFAASEPGGFECSLDGAPFGPCSSPVSYSGLADGRRVFAVRATSAGNADPTPAGSTWLVDTTAPELGGLKLARARISYTLNEAATVGFTIKRRRAGRLVRGHCRRRTRRNRAARRCPLPVAGSLAHAGGAGANSLGFSGRLGGRKLRPGSYVLTAAAADPVGNFSRTTRTRFKVRRAV